MQARSTVYYSFVYKGDYCSVMFPIYIVKWLNNKISLNIKLCTE